MRHIDSVAQDAADGHVPMVSAAHVLARAAAQVQVDRFNAAINAAVQAGADHVDLPLPGGGVDRVYLAARG
ncbi:hypothetical protein [Kerstersia gyiorum]|uniref:hypothetical protein n=1 Tax=Kerstersia gyiorum TaxID=206506 RepID=UPI00128FED5B|nr:hypothetical protein [Kerstersia gyiorum]